MDNLKIGSQAPDFTLKDQNNMDVSLKDFRGKRVLLSYHPFAWTGICVDQMRSIERNYQRFLDTNTVPLGLNVDAQPSKAAWAATLGLKNLKILSDFWPHGKVAADYGVFSQEHGASKRINIIVDENGIIQWFKKYEVSELPDFEEVLEQLKID